MSLEETFDPAFVATLSLKEKQIQQVYRPVIGIHKWFARRPGSVFRSLLLSEFNSREPISESYWKGHRFRGVIADPFMGGGTPIFEAARLGFHVVGTDINPMSYWLVRQALVSLDLESFREKARRLHQELGRRFNYLYQTKCLICGEQAEVKYFLWVKQQQCPHCETVCDLFPGYRLAEAVRHPAHVLVCGQCGALNEYGHVPRLANSTPCSRCGEKVHIEGPARRNKITCLSCNQHFRYPPRSPEGPPEHRLWAMEYHCPACKPGHTGRFFKAPDDKDIARVAEAVRTLNEVEADLPIPIDAIPPGDETDRLHRWGYCRYREMFNPRQLLLLGSLYSEVFAVEDKEVRHALLTVFSDFLRYQNMLCRYDTYALKCQDIFSVHGFPVGLIQCENNVLGIPRVGSGSFIHFIEKYLKAKRYCQEPYERRQQGSRKVSVFTPGERIEARVSDRFPSGSKQSAGLLAAHATVISLPEKSLSGVFTDPPYFDNVQYAELMDFCFAWLRQGLAQDFPEFQAKTTRCIEELTGNVTLGRGIEHFTEGLSAVFRHYAAALAHHAPFVFTYHHNDPVAYAPLVVAILDGGMFCTATLPAAAEMSASLHIAGTTSSILDTIFVCRRTTDLRPSPQIGLLEAPVVNLPESLQADIAEMRKAGIKIREGDVRCLVSGHLARLAISELEHNWDAETLVESRLKRAREKLEQISELFELDRLVAEMLTSGTTEGQARREATDCRPEAI